MLFLEHLKPMIWLNRLGFWEWIFGEIQGRAQGLSRLSQPNLIRTMLDRFGLSDCRSVCTPLDPGAVLQTDGTPLDEKCPKIRW
jgi:hypothetical protein